MLQKSLCPVFKVVAAFGPICIVSVAPGMFSEKGPSGQGGDVILCSSGVPVLLFKLCQSHCSVVRLPLEAISGTAVAGLISANVLHRLKAHPRSLSLLGSSPAQPTATSSGVSSSFLCLCTSLAALSLLPTLGLLFLS